MRFLLKHTTTYRYAAPVTFGRHRLMLRPRDSHEMLLHGATLSISPPPSRTVWQYDVVGNSIALVDFAEPAPALTIESTLDVERFPYVDTEHLLSAHARHLPLSYSAEEIRDLAGLQERHVPDPEHAVDRWAKGFLAPPDGAGGLPETLPVLNAMAAGIRSAFTYLPRDAYGTQAPAETLRSGSGTCRDFAYLMMEGARSLGLAARFVSGYIYDPGRDDANGAPAVAGGGATHAWAQIYLPGAGWMHVDPTNARESEGALIPVAIAREPAHASPISGSWQGRPADALGLDVSVTVTRQA
jgi:transglutaminase-like putative cysteine protease